MIDVYIEKLPIDYLTLKVKCKNGDKESCEKARREFIASIFLNETQVEMFTLNKNKDEVTLSLGGRVMSLNDFKLLYAIEQSTTLLNIIEKWSLYADKCLFVMSKNINICKVST